MPATAHQTHLDELIAAHQARLRKLVVQAALHGSETPAHIRIDIERIEAELAQLKQAAATPVSDELVDAMGPTGRYQLWMSHIMRIDADIYRLGKSLESAIERMNQAQARVEAKVDQLLVRLAGKALEKL